MWFVWGVSCRGLVAVSGSYSQYSGLIYLTKGVRLCALSFILLLRRLNYLSGIIVHLIGENPSDRFKMRFRGIQQHYIVTAICRIPDFPHLHSQSVHFTAVCTTSRVIIALNEGFMYLWYIFPSASLASLATPFLPKSAQLQLRFASLLQLIPTLSSSSLRSHQSEVL